MTCILNFESNLRDANIITIYRSIAIFRMVNRPWRYVTHGPPVAYFLLGQSMLRAKQDGDYVSLLQYIEVGPPPQSKKYSIVVLFNRRMTYNEEYQ